MKISIGIIKNVNFACIRIAGSPSFAISRIVKVSIIILYHEDHHYHEDQRPCQKSWGVDTELWDNLLHLVSVHYQQLTIDRSQFKSSTLTIDRSQYQLSTKWVLSGLIIGNHHNYFYLGLKVENETQSVCWCCVQEVGVERGLVVNRKVFSLSWHCDNLFLEGMTIWQWNDIGQWKYMVRVTK